MLKNVIFSKKKMFVNTLGPHPTYTNVHMMCGFGSRSAMHSIAAARGYAEKILDGAYININLVGFFRRLKKNRYFSKMYF